MNGALQTLSLADLLTACIPLLPVLYFYARWQLGPGKVLYALVRMLAQLLLIGYVLAFIFDASDSWVVLLVLAVMLAASSWIGLTAVEEQRGSLFRHALAAIAVGGGLTLVVITQGVLSLDPWFQPRYMVPLAGMIFANAMNTVGLAAERMGAERSRGEPLEQARAIAFKASLIPMTNMLLAVGIVSLPGMMTGQILSGVSPLIAARYQIMVMCMVMGAAGLSSAVFLLLSRDFYQRLGPVAPAEKLD